MAGFFKIPFHVWSAWEPINGCFMILMILRILSSESSVPKGFFRSACSFVSDMQPMVLTSTEKRPHRAVVRKSESFRIRRTKTSFPDSLYIPWPKHNKDRVWSPILCSWIHLSCCGSGLGTCGLGQQRLDPDAVLGLQKDQPLHCYRSPRDQGPVDVDVMINDKTLMINDENWDDKWW